MFNSKVSISSGVELFTYAKLNANRNGRNSPKVRITNSRQCVSREKNPIPIRNTGKRMMILK